MACHNLIILTGALILTIGYMRRFNRAGRAKHIILCIFFSSVKVVLQQRKAVAEGPEYCDSTLAMALEPNVFSWEW